MRREWDVKGGGDGCELGERVRERVGLGEWSKSWGVSERVGCKGEKERVE